MNIQPVIATNAETGEETYYPSVKSVAEALGVHSTSVTHAIVFERKCRGYYLRREGESDTFGNRTCRGGNR